MENELLLRSGSSNPAAYPIIADKLASSKLRSGICQSEEGSEKIESGKSLHDY